MKIAFTNIDGEDLGFVEFKNATLTGSNDARSGEIEQWIAQGYTPEEYVEYYREWSNGYLTSYTVGDNESETEAPTE